MLLVMFLLASQTAFASSYVKSLKDASTIELRELTQAPSVVVLFQPDCNACRAQIEDLKCFEGKYKIMLLGGFAHEAALRKEYLKTGTRYDAYFADPEVLNSLKISDSKTPQTLVFTPSRSFVFAGYQDCKSLEASVSK